MADSDNYLEAAGGYPLAGGMNWLGSSIGPYLNDVFTGKIAKEGVLGQSTTYDPNRSFAQNALDPAAIEHATDIATSISPSTFYSTGAHLTNRAKLTTAEGMETKGADPTDIWQKTGFFRGADGKWRWEGSDLTASADVGKLIDVLDANKRPPVLPDLYNHPSLYKNYPDMSRIELGVVDWPGVTAGYVPVPDKPGGIVLGRETLLNSLRDPDFLVKSIAHETGHGIEFREGLARGGSPYEFAPPNFPETMEKLGDLRDTSKWANQLNVPRDQLNRLLNHLEAGNRIDVSNARPHIADYFTNYQRLYDENIKYGGINSDYRKLGGEQNSFLTEERLRMDPTLRKETPPFAPGPYGYTHPMSEHIIRYADEPYYNPTFMKAGTPRGAAPPAPSSRVFTGR